MGPARTAIRRARVPIRVSCSPSRLRSLFLVALLLMPAELLAQERPPAAYVQVSAFMRDMRDTFMAGWIEGPVYNEHPSKTIRISEVTVNSSHGKRTFRFNCIVKPYESKEFSLPSGLRLDFRDPQKNWWNLVATRATWAQEAGTQARCPE
jgi:hypothetical protein